MALPITKFLEDVREAVANFKAIHEAIFEYFALKNKVLWEGSWSSGKQTVKDINKYQTLQVWTGLGYHCGMVFRRDNSFRGSAVVGYPTWTATQSLLITIDGDVATMAENYTLSHNGSGSHGAVGSNSYSITKVVGVDPIVPDALKNIIGGGYYIASLLHFLERRCSHV